MLTEVVSNFQLHYSDIHYNDLHYNDLHYNDTYLSSNILSTETLSNISGAFLIPYVIMVILAGVPLIFLEMAIGQYSSLSVVSVWRASPIFQGRE